MSLQLNDSEIESIISQLDLKLDLDDKISLPESLISEQIMQKQQVEDSKQIGIEDLEELIKSENTKNIIDIKENSKVKKIPEKEHCQENHQQIVLQLDDSGTFQVNNLVGDLEEFIKSDNTNNLQLQQQNSSIQSTSLKEQTIMEQNSSIFVTNTNLQNFEEKDLVEDLEEFIESEDASKKPSLITDSTVQNIEDIKLKNSDLMDFIISKSLSKQNNEASNIDQNTHDMNEVIDNLEELLEPSKSDNIQIDSSEIVLPESSILQPNQSDQSFDNNSYISLQSDDLTPEPIDLSQFISDPNIKSSNQMPNQSRSPLKQLPSEPSSARESITSYQAPNQDNVNHNFVDQEQRYIILMDMDAYYAQVEMKKHGLDNTKCVAVQQWQSIIALSYAAKARGVKRSMNCYDALDICPELILIHIQTIETLDFHENCEQAQKPQNQLKDTMFQNRDGDSDESSDEETVGKLIPSSICKTKKISDDPTLMPHRRWWIQMRKKANQKVSLKLYRTESKKIFKIARKYADPFEKASCDECFLDVTNAVNQKYQTQLESIKFDDKWFNAKFMGFKKDENGEPQGRFLPESVEDQKLFIAAQIAYEVRTEIWTELGYTASAGISLNKTVAKIAAGDNKPNGMTIVPRRYFKQALAQVPVKSIRWLGGKLGSRLKREGILTMGDVQNIEMADLERIVGIHQADWVKGLSLGVCNEQIKEKDVPKTCSAIKTFKEIYTFDQVTKQIGLCCTDLIDKMKEHLKAFQVFPVGLQINCQPFLWTYNKQERRESTFHRKVKMIAFDDFRKNTNCFEGYVRKLFSDHNEILPYPLRSLSVSVYNFKPVSSLQQPLTKIKNVFQPVNQIQDKLAFAKRTEEEWGCLNQHVKESKARKLTEVSGVGVTKLAVRVSNTQSKGRGKRQVKGFLNSDVRDCKTLKSFFGVKNQPADQ